MQKPESQNNFQSNAILGREKLEEKKIKDILDSALKINPFNFNADWNEFKDDYSRVATDLRDKMIEARKLWIEMKELGPALEDYLTKSILETVEKENQDDLDFYSKIHIYESLGYANAPEVLSRVLNSKYIIENTDGGYTANILGYFRLIKDQKTIPQIISFIDKAVKLEYGSGDYLRGSISRALGAIFAMVGREKTAEIIENHATQNEAFRKWLTTQNIQGEDLLDLLSVYMTPTLIIEPFDKQRELERLNELNHIPLPYSDNSENYGSWGSVEPYSYLGDSYVPDLHEIESPQPAKPQSELLKLANKARNIANEVIVAGEMDERIGPAARLHIYNALKGDNNNDIPQKDIDKIQRMSQVERRYALKKDFLPTIGIEIETPETSLNKSTQQVLKELNIPNTIGSDYPIRLWEVNPDYSHSPLVQSRVLQELAHMEAIPIDSKTGKLPRDARTSLHINFGLLKVTSREMDSIQNKFHEDISLLNDILTYAFASPYRIRNRKTRNSYDIKVAKDEDHKVFYREGKPALMRLELRAGEFRDYPTFRLLAEAQALTGSLLADIKLEEGFYTGGPSDTEVKIASLWQKIKDEITEYLRPYNLRFNLVDYDPEEAASVMEIPGFKEGCRKIVSKYAKMVLAEVFPKDNKLVN